MPLYQCLNPACRLRFPVTDTRISGDICPACRAATELVAHYPAGQRPDWVASPDTPVVEALLDNIRSVYNVGSMLRTADGAGLRHLYLCGITPSPDHPKIAKTALGAEQAVKWTRRANGWETAVSLKQSGYQLWALEGAMGAENLLETAVPPDWPILLIVGNEIAGVDPGILALCDKTLFIPMQGVKGSLNVASAFAIAVYRLRFSGYTSPLPAATATG